MPIAYRKQFAYWLVAFHGVAMFVLFTAPLLLFLQYLGSTHLWPALGAGGLMAAGFVISLIFVPRWLTIIASHPSARQTPAMRWFRQFVGNGEFIQSIARRIDPDWKNPFSGQTPKATAQWLLQMELMHWATLMASLPPVAAAFHFGYHAFGIIYVFANVIYNLLPILVIRQTRRRLLAIALRQDNRSRA